MLIYELFEDLKFNIDYQNISNAINKSNRLVLKNKPIKKDIIDFDKFGKYKNLVIEFVDIFEKKFDKDQINNMYENLKTLKITTNIPKTKKLSNFISVGYYNSKDNEIVIETDDKNIIKYTMFHELLHMSSRRQKENDYYCGFNILNQIGKGINEDYTEYLLVKYFNKENDLNYRQRLMYNIESIVGEDKLEDLYFNSDLYSLIKELSKYGPKKEIIRLLYAYDSVYNMTYVNNLIMKLDKKMEKLEIRKEKQKVKKYMI